MGYKQEKEKVEKKQNKVKWILLGVVGVLVVITVIFSCFVSPESWKYHFSKPKVAKRRNGELRIHFLDVGQGDSTLIELPDGKVALIDGGDGSGMANKQILRYLNALNIDVIDHLIVTHTDGDHSGGVAEIFKHKKVLNAYMPLSFDVNNVQYSRAYTAAVDEKCNLLSPSRSIRLDRDNAEYTFCFLYPYAQAWEEEDIDENENSAVVWLDYKETSALFCADIGEEAESNLIRDDKLGFFEERGVDLTQTEILKVSHHGSGTSTTQAFLEYIQPQKGIISCGKDNPYGHPAQTLLASMQNAGTTVYRTDKSGHILLTVSAEGTCTVKTQK